MAQIGSFVFLGALLNTQIATSDAAYACGDEQLFTLKASQSDITCSTKDCKRLKCCDAVSTTCAASRLGVNHVCTSSKRTDFTKTGNTAEACCVDKTRCSTSACSDGYKLKTDALKTRYCERATCTHSDRDRCCDIDSTKCRAYTCSTGKTLDATKIGDTGATDALCCKDKGTCATYTENGKKAAELCAAQGQQYDTAKASEAPSKACCKADATKCASMTASCGSGTYLDGAAAGTTTADCCLNLPTCSSYVMPVSVAAASGAQQFASTHHTFAMLLCVLISSVKHL